MQPGDAELVERLQKGEEQAVSILLEQYAHRLYNYAYYHCGDHYLAEDITSETLTKVVTKIGGYVQRDVPFRAWVFRIAHNLLANHLRQRSRHNALSLDEVDWEGNPSVTPPSDWGAADGSEMADQIASHDELKRAIAGLPEDQRNVLILHLIDGFDLGQVAEMLDKTIPAIKSLQYRAIRNLKRALEETGNQSVAANDNEGVTRQKERAG